MFDRLPRKKRGGSETMFSRPPRNILGSGPYRPTFELTQEERDSAASRDTPWKRSQGIVGNPFSGIQNRKNRDPEQHYIPSGENSSMPGSYGDYRKMFKGSVPMDQTGTGWFSDLYDKFFGDKKEQPSKPVVPPSTQPSSTPVSQPSIVGPPNPSVNQTPMQPPNPSQQPKTQLPDSNGYKMLDGSAAPQKADHTPGRVKVRPVSPPRAPSPIMRNGVEVPIGDPPKKLSKKEKNEAAAAKYLKRHGSGVGGAVNHPWVSHVKDFHSKNKGITYKEAMREARKTYHRK